MAKFGIYIVWYEDQNDACLTCNFLVFVLLSSQRMKNSDGKVCVFDDDSSIFFSNLRNFLKIEKYG